MSFLALFLDRDGVINLDYGYVHRPKDFVFNSGVFELVRQANLCHYKVIIITNQAGIGRGYFREEQFILLTRWMFDQFRKNKSYVDALYFCPSHPVYGIGKYRIVSEFRKPAAGMLFRAQMDHNINFDASILVGDMDTDIMAGRSAGVGTLIKFGETSVVDNVHYADSMDAIVKLCAFRKPLNSDKKIFIGGSNSSIIKLL